MNVSLRIAAATGLMLACVACAATRAPASAPFEGREWQLAEVRGAAKETIASLRARPTIRFDAGRLQGFGGCNGFSGSYSFTGGRINFGPLAGTLMACPEPANSVEAAFKAALAGSLDASVDGELLFLRTANETGAQMVFEVAPPPQIEGVTWVITGFNNGRQAVVSPKVGTKPTLAFADGTVSGDAGCNRFHATYTRDGGRIEIGPPAATRKHCPGEGVMEQEREILAAIQSATLWTVERGMLDMHRADGERALTASPAEESATTP